MVKVICILSFILLAGPMRAQDKNVTKGNQQWMHYYNQTKLSDKWSMLIDGGFRWKQGLLKRSQYLIRAAGGYNLIPGIRVAVGLAHLGTYTDLDVTIVEFRPYQELRVKLTLGVLGLNQRLRIEQRFIEATSNNDQQIDRFNWRFRYFIGLSRLRKMRAKKTRTL